MASKTNVINVPANDADVAEVTPVSDAPLGGETVATDEAGIITPTEGTDGTEGTEGTDGDESTEAVDKPELMRINLHVLIDVDPAKWDVTAVTDESAEARDKMIAALIVGGFTPEDAKATAEKTYKPKTGEGPAAVRDAVKEYMLSAMRGLPRITDAGAVVSYYERPAK
jgi:hypothetical protein